MKNRATSDYEFSKTLAVIGWPVLILLIWICSLIGCDHAIAQQVKIIYPGYTSYWNSKTCIPDSVIWIESAHKKVAGRENGFHSSEKRLNLSRDYLHSGYDIGHNCDASDENGNKIDEYNSFDFVNTYPQRPNCNRLTWLALENYTRHIKVVVKIKVSYTGYNGTIGPDKVVIPAYCIKELYYRGRYEKYIIPNNDTVSRHPFTFYKII